MGAPWFRCDRSAARELQGSPFVQGDVVGLLALDLVLRVVLARMVDVSLPVHVFRMHLDDPAADASGLRVPGHMIAHLELFRHAPIAPPLQWRLKYCTARSCFSAAARVLKVPRLRRRPVFGFTLRE